MKSFKEAQFQFLLPRESAAYSKYLSATNPEMRRKLWAEFAAIHAQRPAAMVAAMEKKSGLSVR